MIIDAIVLAYVFSLLHSPIGSLHKHRGKCRVSRIAKHSERDLIVAGRDHKNGASPVWRHQKRNRHKYPTKKHKQRIANFACNINS